MVDEELIAQATEEQDISDLTGDEIVDETEEPGTEDETVTDEAPKEEPKPEPQTDDRDVELKRLRDEKAQLNGHLATILKVNKHREEKGYVDIEEEAEAMGMTPERLKGILSREVESNPFDAQLIRFDKAFYGENGLKGTLDDVYGEDTQTYVQSYNWMLRNDPAERARFEAIEPSKVVSYVIRRGKEASGDFQSYGSASLLDKLKELTAENQALKAKGPSASEITKPKNRVPLNGGVAQAQSRSGDMLRDIFDGR